jgi:hypothetical protein
MKKQLSEPDFIGGQGSLTEEETVALSQYFAKKKDRENKRTDVKSVKAKPRRTVST